MLGLIDANHDAWGLPVREGHVGATGPADGDLLDEWRAEAREGKISRRLGAIEGLLDPQLGAVPRSIMLFIAIEVYGNRR